MPLWAVETILVGTIRDAGTGEPMSNVSVYFRGTKIGTVSNEEGFFYLHVDVNAKVKLVVSAVGYQKQQYDIEPGQSAAIEVLLMEKVSELATIVAMPGENPAVAIMEQVRAHRRQNEHAVSRELSGKSRYFISDIQPRHLKHRLWKNLEGGMVQMADSSYLMPLPTTGYAEYMVPLPEHLNFYETTIPFLSSSFLSPLAASGNSFYRYYLIDSAVVRYGALREKHYRIHFLPKNTFNPTLSGLLEVDSATYALREVRASMPREANVNYLTALQYSASFDASNHLQNEQMAALLEMAVKSDTSRLFPSLLATRMQAAEQLVTPDTLVALDSAMSAFVASVESQKPMLYPDDSVMQAMQDSLLEHPLFRFARWAAKLCYTGYIPTGTPVDIGRVTEIISYTPQEQLHLGLPFRTNESLWKHVSLGGYIGYGFRDRAIKYKAELQVLLPTEKRHLLGLSYSDRYAYTEVSALDALKNENGYDEANLRFTSWLLNGVYYNQSTAYNSAARRRELKFYSVNSWLTGLGSVPSVETQLSVQLGRQGYGDPMLYYYYDMPSYRYASLRGLLRLGWHEKVADFYMQRRYLYSKYPTLYIGAEVGSYSFDEQSVGAMPSSSYHMFGLLHCMVRQDVALGMGGTLSYLAEAGLVLGKVPYPLLAIIDGNQGYTYSPERFTLMNNYQYAADRYLLLHLNWNGRGILFNQIPGVRYLRLHELVEAKMAYGGLSDKHRSVLPFPAARTAESLQPLSMPYVELGVGLGNIFRIGEVYSVWRLTNREDLSAARWAIRFRLHVGM